MHAVDRRSRGRIEGPFEELDADALDASQGLEGTERPGAIADHFHEQAQPDRNDPPVRFGQSRDGFTQEEVGFAAGGDTVRGKLAQGPAEVLEHPPGVAGVEQLDRHRVGPFDERDVDGPEEPGRGHPEVVTNQKQYLHVMAIALPERAAPAPRRARRGVTVTTARTDQGQEGASPWAQRFIVAKQRDRIGQVAVLGKQRSCPTKLGQKPCLGRRRVDVKHDGSDPFPFDLGNQTGAHEGGLPAAGETVYQTNAEDTLSPGGLDPALPESQRLRQAVASPRTGKQGEEKSRVLAAEAAQPLGRGRRQVRRRDRATKGGSEPSLQVLAQVGRRQVAIAHLPGQAAQADALQFPRNRVAKLTRWARFASEDFLEILGGRFPPERQSAGQSSVENHASRPDVGPAIQPVGLATNLLGRHVRKRAGYLSASQSLNLFIDRQAEIADFRPTVNVEQDVGGLQVAMDQSHGVGVMKRVGHACRDPGQPERVEPSSSKQLFQGGPFDVLQDDEAVSGLLSIDRFRGRDEFVDSHDSVMVDRGEALGLLRQRHQPAAAVRVVGTSHLDGELTSGLCISRQVDQKIASAQQADRSIPANPLRKVNMPAGPWLAERGKPVQRGRGGRVGAIEVFSWLDTRSGFGGWDLVRRSVFVRFHLAENGVNEFHLTREPALVVGGLG